MSKNINLHFFVPGLPATAGSKTGFLNKKSGKIIMAPANKRQKPWMSHVQAVALENYHGAQTLLPVHLGLIFFLPRPKGHFGTGKNRGKLKASAPVEHTKKPDLTKMLRAVEDALTGIIWKDDSQVVFFMCSKQYTLEMPGVDINVRTISNSVQPRANEGL